jgi:hypothetical protein
MAAPLGDVRARRAAPYDTVSGVLSREVVIKGCYDQASVNLCPPPTHPPLGR